MKPYRKIGIIVLGLLAAVAVTKVFWPANDGSSAVGVAKRPNILLIMADDLGNNDIGFLGDGSAQTPHIDALARAGARYRRHYANATCRPSRMALLTGMPSSQVGVPPNVRGISPEIITLPEALSQSGYATQHLGKWHLGEKLASSKPDRQGFDDWYGFLNAMQTRHGSLQQPGSTYINPWLEGKHSNSSQLQGHMTDLLTDDAVKKIGLLSGSGQPWFINLWYFAPHQPIEPAAEFARRFADTPEGRYLALVAQLDHSVGRLMAALDDAGVRDNTLVVFLSDNGGTNDNRNSNKPYIGKKNSFQEGALRTPFILNYPGRIAPTDIMDLVFISDVMPTLLDYAGAPIPPSVTGRSAQPLLTGTAMERDSQYFWDFQMSGYRKYGVLDLVHGRLIYGYDMQIWDEERGLFSLPAASDAAVLLESAALYRRWAQETRRVALQPERLADGGLRISGDSYRRTPGFGGWTLQLPVVIAPGRVTRVEQSGQFGIAVVGGDMGASIEVELPGYRFSVQAAASGCQLLSLSSYYRWSEKKPWASRGQVDLYFGEDLVYQEQFPLQLDILKDRYEPTILSAGAGQPVISNDYLQVDLLQHYQQAIGKAVSCEAQGGLN